ncbi:MAG: hypothetical protein WBM00_01395 [Solirubrobacterales bacterium]
MTKAIPGLLTRARAWLVTGPVGRGLSFAIDFAAAARVGIGRYRRSRANR